jgi:Ca-activated chloride channel family protein
MTDLAQFHFAEPHWLWLAVLGPLALSALQRYAAWARRRQLANVASARFVDELTGSHSPLRRVLKDGLLLLAVALMGLALARPQWGLLEIADQRLGEDVVFAVDCSQSMLAADVSPNRLERARQAVLDFIHRNGSGRVGLVAFAGQAFLQCPLTFDYGAFEDALRGLDGRTIPVAGTDLGRAMDEAFQAMEKTDRRKVVVLVTDGEDLEKAGVRIAGKLKEQGIVVFTVGVGTAAGTEIRVLNAQNQPELLRDSRGEVVRSRLDEETLREVAKATGGRYFPLGELGEGLAQVRLALIASDADATGTTVRKLGVDRYELPVAVLLLMLVAESLIGTRRYGGRQSQLHANV